MDPVDHITAENDLLRSRIIELKRLLVKAGGPMSYGHWSSDFRAEVDKTINK